MSKGSYFYNDFMKSMLCHIRYWISYPIWHCSIYAISINVRRPSQGGCNNYFPSSRFGWINEQWKRLVQWHHGIWPISLKGIRPPSQILIHTITAYRQHVPFTQLCHLWPEHGQLQRINQIQLWHAHLFTWEHRWKWFFLLSVSTNLCFISNKNGLMFVLVISSWPKHSLIISGNEIFLVVASTNLWLISNKNGVTLVVVISFLTKTFFEVFEEGMLTRTQKQTYILCHFPKYQLDPDDTPIHRKMTLTLYLNFLWKRSEERLIIRDQRKASYILRPKKRNYLFPVTVRKKIG